MMRFYLFFVLASMQSFVYADEPESDTTTYMKASALQTMLSHCLLVSKEQGKQAKILYDTWLEPRKDAVSRIASQGCGQMCQMFGDPMQGLRKPHTVESGPFALSKEEISRVCQDGIEAAQAQSNSPPTQSVDVNKNK